MKSYSLLLDRKAYKNLNTNQAKNASKNAEYSAQNLAQEIDLNLDEGYRQLGIPRPRITGNARTRVTGPNLGWNNMDKKVIEATIARTTINVEQDGKKAQIQYLPVTFKINNEFQYDRVMVYLLPEELESYQRVMKSEAGFTEKLNEFFKYRAVVVGYKGDDLYLGKEYKVTTGEYTLALIKSNKKQLKQALTDYGRTKKISNLVDDIVEKQSILFQQKAIQKMEDNTKFREKLAANIFECYKGKLEAAIIDDSGYEVTW